MTTTPDNSAQHTTSQPSQPNVSQHLPNNPGVPNLTPCMTGQQVTDLLHARYTAKKYNPNPVSYTHLTLPTILLV